MIVRDGNLAKPHSAKPRLLPWLEDARHSIYLRYRMQLRMQLTGDCSRNAFWFDGAVTLRYEYRDSIS